MSFPAQRDSPILINRSTSIIFHLLYAGEGGHPLSALTAPPEAGVGKALGAPGEPRQGVASVSAGGKVALSFKYTQRQRQTQVLPARAAFFAKRDIQH